MTDRDALRDRLDELEDTVGDGPLRVEIRNTVVDAEGDPLPDDEQPDPTVVEW